MLIFFVFVKLLSLMTNTRVGLAHTPKWPNCGSGNTCSGERSGERIWNLHRKYAGSGGMNQKAGEQSSAFHLYIPFSCERV